ncbi:GNAT family N-acetyltransferase [Caulobacter sp. BP25]|uniref:GNAT family N-acetyltransferase n=1 Tax=Caulobacter sp. BP25 TaxID=2048900 RepID=UPI000C12A339|nr:GNAT family protein [Caulobacter sp. BP25]PHY18167.1 GNAT family N-acetyltransferase [Caulobacter sp. BP25]
MLIEAGPAAFAALMRGEAPAPYRLCDSPLTPPEVLAMLARLAEQIGFTFRPSAWMIVENDEIVGLISPTQTLDAAERSLRIGYGVAPSRQGAGVATRAVGDLAVWARTDDRVRALTAETAVDNLASQKALARNGFMVVGAREDAEDGPLICWRLET